MAKIYGEEKAKGKGKKKVLPGNGFIKHEKNVEN
jgi:hypothetical protein